MWVPRFAVPATPPSTHRRQRRPTPRRWRDPATGGLSGLSALRCRRPPTSRSSTKTITSSIGSVTTPGRRRWELPLGMRVSPIPVCSIGCFRRVRKSCAAFSAIRRDRCVSPPTGELNRLNQEFVARCATAQASRTPRRPPRRTSSTPSGILRRRSTNCAGRATGSRRRAGERRIFAIPGMRGTSRYTSPKASVSRRAGSCRVYLVIRRTAWLC